MENTASNSGSSNKSYLQSIVIIGVLFFIFGFVTWLNATLIPFLQIACELTDFQAYFVTFAFYISYLVFSLPASWVLHKTGYKKGMALGLVIMALGSLIFIPAAETRYYPLFLLGLFIQGAGLSILQTASNPYIVILGPIESAAKRISIMGICNKVAGVISPLILAAVVLKDADAIKLAIETSTDAAQKLALLNEMAGRVVVPYIIMAIALVALAVMIALSPLPDIDTDKEEDHVNESSGTKTSIFQFPYFLIGAVALFFYVGAEVIAVDTIILYGNSLGFSFDQSKLFSSLTLSAMVLGYILGILLIPKYLSQAKALTISAVLGFICSVLAVFTSGFASVFFIALLGLANAIMWPAIWPLAIEGLGKFTKIAAAILVMAIAGGATLPLLYGKISDLASRQEAYWLMVPIYIIIFYFATAGHKVGKKPLVQKTEA
jgi:MFS transporter, FHS family, L-fucose permease